MTAPSSNATDIDVVIAWVDGDDPRHAEKLARFLGQAPRTEWAAPTRFRSVGEIDYAICSVLRHAPFVRRVHVVTDEQRPALFDRAAAHWPREWADKLVLVDHRDIFQGFEQHLPTFNCRPIETLLYRIPGLAEQFVYLNDDFMLIRPIGPDAWFRDGWPVLRGEWRLPIDREWSQRLRQGLRALLGRPKPLRPLHQRSQALAASLVGYHRRYFSTHHVPNPMRRSTLERYFGAHPEVQAGNVVHRLRDVTQFNTPSLANHLEIQAGTVHLLGEAQRCYAEPFSLDAAAMQAVLDAADADPEVVFACFQSLDEATPDVQDRVLRWLDRRVGTDPQPAA